MHTLTDDQLKKLLRNGPETGSVWVHTATDTAYRVLFTVIIEATLTLAIVYEREGVRWARPLSEFTDGRFVQVL